MQIRTNDRPALRAEAFIIRLIRFIIIFLFFVLFATLMLRVAEAEAPTEAQDSEIRVIEAPYMAPETSIEDLVVAKAKEYGLDPVKALRIAKCESGLNPLAKNPNSSAKGIFQFIDGTWSSVSRIRGISASVLDAEANIDNAMWLAKKEGWKHWVCQ